MQPFRTILFAADFSENSREAFRATCALAVETKTRLFVVHVVVPEGPPEEPVCEGRETMQLPADKPRESRLEPVRQRLREFYVPHRPIDIDYQTREGDPSQEILRMAQEIGSDLIAMGTHGLTGVRRLLAGSVAIAVLHGARCPVMALRSGARPRPGKEIEIRVILHPTDFSAGSEVALRVARSLARDHAARLILLHVVPLPVGAQGAMTASLDLGEYNDALEAARAAVEGPDLKYPVETWLSRGDAPDEILRLAKQLGSDLIVMGTHGRTGLGRLLLGNTAESVLPDADCPVIVLKSPKPVAPTTSSSPSDKKVATAGRTA